ncbi:hypothetical protein L7F22_039653 [Adiantum nelumboides]|nr:hypothetical protein [Adiantum nelumboides]
MIICFLKDFLIFSRDSLAHFLTLCPFSFARSQSPLHATHPLVHNRHVDIIYLDTTYLNPRYCFPAQEQVVLACADLVRSAMPLVTEGEPNWDEDEDWRIAPPRKGQVNEVDRKAGIALRGWLDKRGKGNDPSGKGKVKEEDEDEFGFNDDDELPELEDEDSLRAKGKLQEMDLPAGADEDDTADFDLLKKQRWLKKEKAQRF